MVVDKFMGYGRTVVNWKIGNFTKDLLNTTSVPHLNSIESPEFEILLSNYERPKWKFIAHRNCTQLTLYVKCLPQEGVFKESEFIVNYALEVKDQLWGVPMKRIKGKVTVCTRRYYCYEKRLGKIINGKECEMARARRTVHNKTLHIVVYLEVLQKEMDLSYVLNATLTSHYEELFNKENNDNNEEKEKTEQSSDFVITSSDGKDIFVHKNILCSRSPVFEAMINTSMKEKSEKKVLITDIDGRTLKELIRFIYAGKVNEIDSIASELLYAANKYDVKDLKPLCVESLAINVTLDNVLETMVLADLHGEAKLKTFCMDFVKWNYFELRSNEGWKKMNADVLKSLLDFVMDKSRYNKKTEITVVTNIKRTADQNVATN